MMGTLHVAPIDLSRDKTLVRTRAKLDVNKLGVRIAERHVISRTHRSVCICVRLVTSTTWHRAPHAKRSVAIAAAARSHRRAAVAFP
ncbi:unnamed protein product, partial [Iphiclides podalirius]